MSTSADLSFRAVLLARKLLPADVIDQALSKAEARGQPLGRYLLESGKLEVEAFKLTEGIQARWGRACAACREVTYLLPARTEADTPCEHCGGALVPGQAAPPGPGRRATPGPARRPAPGRRPPSQRAPAPRPAPAPAPPPALIEEDEDEGPPLPETIGAVQIAARLGEGPAVVAYLGGLRGAMVGVRVLRPERAQRPHEVDAFQRAIGGAVAAGFAPLDLGLDSLGAPFLVVGLPAGDVPSPGDELTRKLLELAPPPVTEVKDPNASSDTGSLIFERLEKQRQQLLHDVAQASRRRERCVDRFVLLELLAQDAGQLWRGFDSDSNEVVAVRVFPWEQERLSAELEEVLTGAGRPRHAHVLPLREHGVADGRLFLVREHTALAPLAANSPELFLRRAVQLAQGLGYLHGLGLVHGGIHHGSAVLRPDGTPVLTDLGAAASRAASDSPPLPWRLVRAGCTPPESADGRPDDAAGDVFALGAVLFRAAAAWLPTEPAAPPAPGSAAPAPDRARDLLAVLQRCLAADPAERYPGGMELARELEKVQQGALPAASQPRAPAPEESGVKPSSVVSTLSGVFKKLLGRGQ